jgi:hypothetical protein
MERNFGTRRNRDAGRELKQISLRLLFSQIQINRVGHFSHEGAQFKSRTNSIGCAAQSGSSLGLLRLGKQARKQIEGNFCPVNSRIAGFGFRGFRDALQLREKLNPGECRFKIEIGGGKLRWYPRSKHAGTETRASNNVGDA